MTIQTTTFKGARYIVKFHDPIQWSSSESYEAIEAVQNEGFTYISKQPVPTGIDIENEDFWLVWADPNAQMEQLRQLVSEYVIDVEGVSDDILTEHNERVNADLDIMEEITMINFKYNNYPLNNHSTNIYPYLIGIDYGIGSNSAIPQYSCVVQHGNVYYGMFPLNDGTNKGNLAMYNDITKNIVRQSDISDIGHGNSICYIDSLDVIYASNEGSVNVFDSTFFNKQSTIQAPITIYGISYDSVENKLYAMHNVNSTTNSFSISELAVETLSIIETKNYSFEILGNMTLQDIAVNDSMAYVSTPQGFVIKIDLETDEIVNTFNILGIDAGFTRRLGELEGFEFNENGRLVAAHTINIAPYGCIGFTTSLNAKDYMPNYQWMNQTRSITFNGANIDKWHNEANIISSLMELTSMITDTIARVDVYGTVPVQTYSQTPILKSCEINVRQNAVLNVNRLVPSCNTLVIFNQGTINFTAASVSAIHCGVYENTQLTLNNYGTITHVSSATHPLITLGYTKQPCVIGNLGTGTISIDRYDNVSQSNTIWLGGNYPIRGTY